MSCWCFAFLFRCISLVRHFVALSGKKTRRDFSPTLLDIWSYLSKQYEFPWNSKPIIYHHYFKYFVKSTPHDLLFPAEKRGNLKRKVVFQPSCLRGYVCFRGSTKKMRIEQFFVPIVCCLPLGKKNMCNKECSSSTWWRLVHLAIGNSGHVPSQPFRTSPSASQKFSRHCNLLQDVGLEQATPQEMW